MSSAEVEDRCRFMLKETRTFVLYDERHKNHQTRKSDPCEVSERIETAREALIRSGIEIAWRKPEVCEHPLVFLTHSREMIDALRKYSSLAEPDDQIFTRFCRDFTYSTPITRGTFNQAMISACCSIEAAELIKTKTAKLTLSLSRPPGHHAGHDFYHGFCFFNNSALAARNLREKAEKVAILDFDIHHCDGTQDIFYRTGEVLVISLHADPNLIFPHTGFAEDQGEELGKGMIVNIPLEVGISAGEYKKRFNGAIKILDDFRPDALVVEAGFDGHKTDFPPGGQPLTELSDEDFGHLGERIGSLDIPCCVVFGGGYNISHLPNSVLAFFTALENRLIKGRKTL